MTTNYFDGRISKVGFFKPSDISAQASSIISTTYNGGVTTQYGKLTAAFKTDSGLSNWYDLNEYDGNAIDAHGTSDWTDNNTVTSAIGPGTDKIADESSNANHGTITNFTNTGDIVSTDVPSALAGSLDYSMYFDKAAGTQQNLAFTNPSATTWSLSIHFKKDTAADGTGYDRLLETPSNDFLLAVSANVDDHISFYDGAAWTDTGIDVSLNEWHYISVTYDGSDLVIDFNGSETTYASRGRALSTPGTAYISKANAVNFEEFGGHVADYRIYSDVLSTNERTYLRTGGTSGTDPGTGNLLRQWGGSNDSYPIGAVVDGQPVIRITDRSADGVDAAQTTLAKRPIYDSANSGISFDGADDLADLVGSLSVTDFTIFAVATLSNTVTSATSAMSVVASQTDGAAGNARGSLFFGDAGLPTAETLTALAYTGSVDNKSYASGITSTIAAGKYLITTKLDGTTTSIRLDGVGQSLTQIGLNGVLDSSDGAKRFNQTAWRIAANHLTTGNLDGTIHCILIYDSALSDDDIASVESYLSDQYGLGL